LALYYARGVVVVFGSTDVVVASTVVVVVASVVVVGSEVGSTVVVATFVVVSSVVDVVTTGICESCLTQVKQRVIKLSLFKAKLNKILEISFCIVSGFASH